MNGAATEYFRFCFQFVVTLERRRNGLNFCTFFHTVFYNPNKCTEEFMTVC